MQKKTYLTFTICSVRTLSVYICFKKGKWSLTFTLNKAHSLYYYSLYIKRTRKSIVNSQAMVSKKGPKLSTPPVTKRVQKRWCSCKNIIYFFPFWGYICGYKHCRQNKLKYKWKNWYVITVFITKIRQKMIFSLFFLLGRRGRD